MACKGGKNVREEQNVEGAPAKHTCTTGRALQKVGLMSGFFLSASQLSFIFPL